MKHFVLTCALAACALSAQAAPDPYFLFGQARHYWEHQHYPALIEYRVAVDVEEGGKEKIERYHSGLDATTGSVEIDPISDWEEAHPASGTGMNVSLLFLRIGKPEPPVDFIGVPLLSPAYSFGIGSFPKTVPASAMTDAEIVAQIRAEFHDPNPRAQPTPAVTPTPSLREIASVVAYKHDYAIALAGSDVIDGHPCYHLQLAPLHDPGRFRLRDLWIDEANAATWKLTAALNFVDGPGTNVAWTVRFADVDGAHYVKQEDANAPIATQGLIYTKTTVRFEDIHTVTKLSFRPTEYLPANFVTEP